MEIITFIYNFLDVFFPYVCLLVLSHNVDKIIFSFTGKKIL